MEQSTDLPTPEESSSAAAKDEAIVDLLDLGSDAATPVESKTETAADGDAVDLLDMTNGKNDDHETALEGGAVAQRSEDDSPVVASDIQGEAIESMNHTNEESMESTDEADLKNSFESEDGESNTIAENANNIQSEILDSSMDEAPQRSLPDGSIDGGDHEATNESTYSHQSMDADVSQDSHVLVESLQKELEKSHALIELLQKQQQQQQATKGDDDSESLLVELQSNLQHQMSLKAEAENKARLAENKIKELEAMNQTQAEEIQQFYDLQENLQLQMNAKAEAENKARMALERVRQLESERDQQIEEISKFEDLETSLERQISSKSEAESNARLALERVESLENEKDQKSEEIMNLQKQVCEARETMEAQEQELQKIREERDEQRRKEIALTNRLNAAKMKEADKANLAEQYEDDIKGAEQELHDTKTQLMETKADKERLEKELEQLKVSSNDRVSRAERALADERRLNEERKRKMKVFVETKADELRQAKEDNESLQVELSQTNASHLDFNNRWKQLHEQYIQSQTRNRELQRDLNRMKKDSENLHKVGDTLEMKLSRSATETEEHKNKRLAAKHELMTVLRTLEAEREVTAKLRDTIKFTFTPKALSQQQLLRESLDDFETQLQKLSQRLGRPLPLRTIHPPIVDESEGSDHSAEENGSSEDKTSRSDADINRLIAKLEKETQAVSQCIMALTGNVERMHLVLDASGERNCYSILSEIFTTGGADSSPAAQHNNDDSDASSPGRRRLRAITSARHRYGSVPSAAPH